MLLSPIPTSPLVIQHFCPLRKIIAFDRTGCRFFARFTDGVRALADHVIAGTTQAEGCRPAPPRALLQRRRQRQRYAVARRSRLSGVMNTITFIDLRARPSTTVPAAPLSTPTTRHRCSPRSTRWAAMPITTSRASALWNLTPARRVPVAAVRRRAGERDRTGIKLILGEFPVVPAAAYQAGAQRAKVGLFHIARRRRGADPGPARRDGRRTRPTSTLTFRHLGECGSR